MKSPMQHLLGAELSRLPLSLRAHYEAGHTTDRGQLDVEYPWFMQPVLSALGLFGVLVDRRGHGIETVVIKQVDGERQYWRRTLRYPDGRLMLFNSVWEYAGRNELIEFVRPWLGLKMTAWVSEGRLHYRSVSYILQIGRFRLSIPEWLSLGRAHITEESRGGHSFTMDFRLVHPVFGQVFRYAGLFETAVGSSGPAPGSSPGPAFSPNA